MKRFPGRATIGGVILRAAPILMKTLSVAGTIAMFMVGGSILMHGIPGWHHVVEGITHALPAVPGLATISGMLIDAFAGVIAGALILVVVTLATRLSKKARAA